MALFILLGLIHVSLAREPSLKTFPTNFMKALNDNVFIMCKADVVNPDLITEMNWSGPDGQEIPNAEGSIITINDFGDPGNLDLIIRNMREEDAGTYVCTATYAGTQKLRAELKLESYMVTDFGNTPTHHTIINGTDFKIGCSPKGKPRPQVDWLKDGNPLMNDRRYIIQEDGILIKGITLADEGIYKCRARVVEIGTIAFRDIRVEVSFPPKIDIIPEYVEGVENDTATFECGAIGNPNPTYSWINKDNETLKGKENYYVDAEKGLLKIINLKAEHSGNYRCIAQNPLGNDSVEANLKVFPKPKIKDCLNIMLPGIVFKKESTEETLYSDISYDGRIEIKQTTDDQGQRVAVMNINGVLRSNDGLPFSFSVSLTRSKND